MPVDTQGVQIKKEVDPAAAQSIKRSISGSRVTCHLPSLLPQTHRREKRCEANWEMLIFHYLGFTLRQQWAASANSTGAKPRKCHGDS